MPSLEQALSTFWLLFLPLITTNSSTINQCMQNRRSVASMIRQPFPYYYQLRSTRHKLLEWHSPMIDNVQLRTGFINFLSLDHHELFHYSYSHNGSGFSCVCKIEGVWRAWFPVLYFSALITRCNSWKTYSPMIDNVHLRTGFIKFRGCSFSNWTLPP